MPTTLYTGLGFWGTEKFRSKMIFMVPRRGLRVYAGRYSWAKKKIPVHFSDGFLT